MLFLIFSCVCVLQACDALDTLYFLGIMTYYVLLLPPIYVILYYSAVSMRGTKPAIYAMFHLVSDIHVRHSVTNQFSV